VPGPVRAALFDSLRSFSKTPLMVSFSLRQRIFFTSPADTRPVSFHLSQFVVVRDPKQFSTLQQTPNKLRCVVFPVMLRLGSRAIINVCGRTGNSIRNERTMTSLKDTIRQTGRSPIFRVSWSKAKLAELRREGARKIQLAATQRQAQFDRHLSWAKLLDLITDPVIISHHADVFAEDSFQLVETRLYPKPPQAGEDWHIDFYQLLYYKPSLLDSDLGDFHSVTTWLALADVPVEMGP